MTGHIRKRGDAWERHSLPFRLRMVGGDVLEGYEHAAVDGETAWCETYAVRVRLIYLTS